MFSGRSRSLEKVERGDKIGTNGDRLVYEKTEIEHLNFLEGLRQRVQLGKDQGLIGLV